MPSFLNIARSLSFFSLALLFSACSSSLLREETVEDFNKRASKKYFRTRKNIYPPFESKESKRLSFRRGVKVRIVLEQGDDWLKVRAFPLHENEEQSRGKVILFISRELLSPEEQDNYSLPILQKNIQSLLKESSFSAR